MAEAADVVKEKAMARIEAADATKETAMAIAKAACATKESVINMAGDNKDNGLTISFSDDDDVVPSTPIKDSKKAEEKGEEKDDEAAPFTPVKRCLSCMSSASQEVQEGEG